MNFSHLTNPARQSLVFTLLMALSLDAQADATFDSELGANSFGEYFYDVFEITAENEQDLEIEISSDFDSFMMIVLPNGNVLVDDDSGAELNASIQIENAAMGTHTVVVTSYSGSVEGEYQLLATGASSEASQIVNEPDSVTLAEAFIARDYSTPESRIILARSRLSNTDFRASLTTELTRVRENELDYDSRIQRITEIENELVEFESAIETLSRPDSNPVIQILESERDELIRTLEQEQENADAILLRQRSLQTIFEQLEVLAEYYNRIEQLQIDHDNASSEEERRSINSRILQLQELVDEQSVELLDRLSASANLEEAYEMFIPSVIRASADVIVASAPSRDSGFRRIGGDFGIPASARSSPGRGGGIANDGGAGDGGADDGGADDGGADDGGADDGGADDGSNQPRPLNINQSLAADIANEQIEFEDWLPGLFPWPPPPPSSRVVWNSNQLRTQAGFSTLGEIDQLLRSALQSANYPNVGYYGVPGGFALVTQLEQIEPSGSPLPDRLRWYTEPVAFTSFSVFNYLKSLLTATSGNFRIFVFVVNTEGVAPDSETEAVRATLIQWATNGHASLPGAIAESALNNDHTLTALVYEFTKELDSEAVVKVPGTLSVTQHFAASDIVLDI